MGMLKLWWETISDIARTVPREHLDMLRQDARYALRTMRKNPGFTTVAVLTLALGIGANTAIFSVVNAVLLRPLPYSQPERLVMLFEENQKRGLVGFHTSPPTLGDWRREGQVLTGAAAYLRGEFVIAGEGAPVRLSGMIVSTDFFSLLGVVPALGRSFQPEEGEPGTAKAVVISHSLWRARYGSDPKILGRKMRMNDMDYEVIGVLPESFWFPDPREVWVPLSFTPEVLTARMRGARYLPVLARLRPGVSREQALARMNALAAQLGEQYPNNAGWTVSLVPMHARLVGGVRPVLLILFAAVGFVLLIASTNVANLLLARATARQKEIALRQALGASRARLLRQFLTESVMIFALGGLLGVLPAGLAVRALVQLAPERIPRLDNVALDGQVLLFAVGVSLLTGLLFGLIPALRAGAASRLEALGAAGRSPSTGPGAVRLRGFLVISEVALSLVLLIGAGLLVRSFLRLQAVNPGFNPTNVMTVPLSLSTTRYSDRAQQAEFFKQVLERWKESPGVRSTGGSTNLPLSGSTMTFQFRIPGWRVAPNETLYAQYHATTPGYFRTVGIPLLQGRAFADGDNPESRPVAIINQTMARRYWSGQDPVGQTFSISSRNGLVEKEIVGVVGDTKHSELAAAPVPEVYVPFAQDAWPFLTLVVRSDFDPSAQTSILQSELWAVDEDLPAGNFRSLEGLRQESIRPLRFQTILMSAFSLLAVVLAGVGIYGVVSYAVNQRTREIGIRMALGAQRRNILLLILGRGLGLTLMGVGLGVAAAVGVTRFLERLLFGVTPTDPVTYLGVAVTLSVVALLACWIPARRAMRVDPMVALRYE